MGECKADGENSIGVKPAVTLEIPLEQPFYDLLRIELEGTNHENLEDLVRSWLWVQLDRRFYERADPCDVPVGVTDEVADRLVLRAEFYRQLGKDPETAWADTVTEFVDVRPVVLDENDEDVRKRFDGETDERE